MMKRDAALEVLARKYPDGIVVAVFQSAFDWMPHRMRWGWRSAAPKKRSSCLMAMAAC